MVVHRLAALLEPSRRRHEDRRGLGDRVRRRRRLAWQQRGWLRGPEQAGRGRVSHGVGGRADLAAGRRGGCPRRGEERARSTSRGRRPPGAREVRVVRQRKGSRPDRPEGRRPRRGDCADSTHDSGLEDDRVYHYGIFAIYPLPDGRMVPSRGVFVSAQPHVPVPVPAAPVVTAEPDGRVRLSWPEPSRGTVRVLRTSKVLPMAPGERLPAASAESLDGRWIEEVGPGQAIDPSPPRCGLPLHVDACLGGDLDRRARRSATRVSPRPVGPPRHAGRQRGQDPPPMALEPPGFAITARRAVRFAPARTRRPRNDQDDRARGRVQPPGILDAHAARALARVPWHIRVYSVAAV